MNFPKIALPIIALLMIACTKDGRGGSDSAGDKFASNSIVVVDPTLQSNMIIQQNSKITFTGIGSVADKIRVKCGWQKKELYHVVDVGSDGRWSVSVSTPRGGSTPYSVVVEGRTKVIFENILVGEVWLCAGQSNMFWPLKDAQNGVEDVANARNTQIRILNMVRTTSALPTNGFEAKWQPCMPDIAKEFSAVGYHFGRLLQQELSVPVGLIGSNWGNTGIEVWGERNAMLQDGEVAEYIAKRDVEVHSDGSPNVCGSAYNAMVYPLHNIPISGVIWYQGENNQRAAYLYPKMLELMVGQWRETWGVDFHFYMAQICPYKRDWVFETNYSNSAMRFMQAEATKMLPKSGVTVNDDVADILDIHPRNKLDVGNRLAWLALGDKYGVGKFATKRSPIFDKALVSGDKIIVSFRYAEQGLKSSDLKPLTMFEICGIDRVFYPAQAQVVGNTVEVSCSGVVAPVAVRMGWSYTKVTNLCSSDGLPVSVFRSYTWSDEAEEI